MTRYRPIPAVYLLHFTRPVGHAQHYIGFSNDVTQRIQAHKQGRGNPLVRAAVARGCGVQLARTWAGDRALERKLKNRKSAPRFCPLCNPSKAWRLAW